MNGPIRTFTTTLAALGLGALSLVSAAAASPSTPGVTSTQVSLGAIVTQSGFLAADFAPYLEGVEAYLNYVNTTDHGVNGRLVKLTDVQDDASNSDDDVSETRAMATSSNVFAIVGYATAFFDSKDLAKSGIPVFGYGTTSNWEGPSNFFADYGSAVDYATVVPEFGFVAKQLAATRIAVLAYPKVIDGAAYEACSDTVKGLKSYGLNVVYSNLNDQVFATNYDSDVTNMMDDDVDMIVSCMQGNDNVTLNTDLHEQGMTSVPEVWLDGYDRTLLSQAYPYMNDVYVLIQHIPFDAVSAYPDAYPGLSLYFAQMQASGYGSDEGDDVALAGWESANLFVEGLRAAGKNPTRASVLKALNKITSDVGGPKGDGVTAPVDWKTAHTKPRSPACVTFVKTADTSSSSAAKFVMAFNDGSDPWVCFPLKGAKPASPVAAPAGTPGA